MFEKKIYYLGVPVPRDVCDELTRLTLEILKKEAPSATRTKLQQLLKSWNVKGEYHITIGVFHAGIFESYRALFKQLISYLQAHKADVWQPLKDRLRSGGRGVVMGVGYDGNSIASSQVIWAAVDSASVVSLREELTRILAAAGITEKQFTFTDPHITLVTKPADVHGIRKLAKIPLHDLLPDRNGIDIVYTDVVLMAGFKPFLRFGDGSVDGKPSIPFKKRLSEYVDRLPK